MARSRHFGFNFFFSVLFRLPVTKCSTESPCISVKEIPISEKPISISVGGNDKYLDQIHLDIDPSYKVKRINFPDGNLYSSAYYSLSNQEDTNLRAYVFFMLGKVTYSIIQRKEVSEK